MRAYTHSTRLAKATDGIVSSPTGTRVTKDGTLVSVVLFTNSIVMVRVEQHLIQLARDLNQRACRVGVICSGTEEISERAPG